MGIYSIHKYLYLRHYDLHWGNVLYYKIPDKGFIKYKINKKTEITIESSDYLFMLTDFGNSRFFDSYQDKNNDCDYAKHAMLKGYEPSNKLWKQDYIRISSMLIKDEEQTVEAYSDLGKNFIRLIREAETPEKFFESIGKAINHENIPNDKIIGTFDMTKKIKTSDSFMKNFISHKLLH